MVSHQQESGGQWRGVFVKFVRFVVLANLRNLFKSNGYFIRYPFLLTTIFKPKKQNKMEKK